MEPATPLLTAVRAEQVTQNPLTFTSTFSIPVAALLLQGAKPDGPPETYTDRCGLGWTFGVQAHRLVSPLVANSILQPVLAAARIRDRLTIVDSSGQNSIPATHSSSDATNLTVRVHFDSSKIALAGNLEIKHISCSLHTPGPEGVTRSCDKVLVAPAETVTIGTFSYEYDGGGNGEVDTFMFTFAVEMGNAQSENKTIPQQIERRAAAGLAESIRTGCMVDTKFYLYSKKATGGGASHPKEIYASSAILCGFSEDLDLLLASHGFKGSETVPLDLFELQDEDMKMEADYPGEDSDLESEGPFQPRPTQCSSPFKKGNKEKGKGGKGKGGKGGKLGRKGKVLGVVPSSPTMSPFPLDAPVPRAMDCSPPVGSDSHDPIEAPTCQLEDVSSCDPEAPSPSVVTAPTSVLKVDEDGDGDKAKPTNEDLTVALTHVQTVTDKNFMRMGRVIVIKDTAFATWEALIRYVYFNEVHFNSIGAGFSIPGGCSPKSMYRLADKFGIQTLKDLALQNIKTQMSVQNITREVFSTFSSLYPDILHAEIEYLLNNYADSNIQAGISQVLQTTVTGEHAYRLDAMQRIMSGLATRSQSLTQPKLCSQGCYCHYCYKNHYR